MANLSEILKKSREDSGLTLQKFSDISKIQIKYLSWLEKGEYEKLPAPVYLQGFLKKYIQILNLDENDIWRNYHKEFDGKLKDNRLSLTALPILKNPRTIITPKRLAFSLIGIVAVVIIGYLALQIKYLIAPPLLNIFYPSDNLITNQTTIEVRGKTESSAKLTVNGRQIYIDNNGNFSQAINLNSGLNTLSLEAENRFGKKTNLTRRITVQ